MRQGVQIPVGKGFAGRIAAERRSIIIEDVDHADILNPLLRRRGIRSLLGVPLLVEGDVIGVMHVGTLRHRCFGAEEQRLLQLAADRAALAIDHARLKEQRALTEVMQRTLLPPAPRRSRGSRSARCTSQPSRAWGRAVTGTTSSVARRPPSRSSSAVSSGAAWPRPR